MSPQALSSWDRFTEFQNPPSFSGKCTTGNVWKRTSRKKGKGPASLGGICVKSQLQWAYLSGSSISGYDIYIYMIYGSEMNLQNGVWSLKCRTICRSFTSQLACCLKLANYSSKNAGKVDIPSITSHTNGYKWCVTFWNCISIHLQQISRKNSQHFVSEPTKHKLKVNRRSWPRQPWHVT